MAQAKELALKTNLHDRLQKLANNTLYNLNITHIEQDLQYLIDKNPSLLECSNDSIISSLLVCANLNLRPLDASHIYIYPFFEGKGPNRRKVAKPIIGFRGMMLVAARNGINITSNPVYENDDFNITLGTNPTITHNPPQGFQPRGNIIGFYAFAQNTDGRIIAIAPLMSTAEMIQHARKYSPSYTDKDGHIKQNSIWAQNFMEMGQKTMVRKLYRILALEEGEAGRQFSMVAHQIDTENTIEGTVVEEVSSRPDALEEIVG